MLIDKIFLMLLVFFVTFTWLKYYKYSTAIAVLGGILLAALIHTVINFLFRSKKERKKLKVQEKKWAQRLANYLAFNPNSKRIIADALTKSASNYITKENGFLVTRDGKAIFLVASFSLLPVSADFVCRAVQAAVRNGANEVKVLCCSADRNSLNATNLSPLSTKIHTIDDVYAYLKKCDCLPELQNTKRMRAVSLKNFGSLFFHRSRAKVYFTTSIFLILFSYISMFKLYDLIMGSIVLLFAVYARFNKRFNLPTEQDLEL